ncbi:Biotin transporter [Bosea sp. 62]|uniref:biotin transporter BioY n=1 Tax=unclassified Bosea (in: a-proteobacteria) TaxID=2653178 RepID=UPI001256B7ED|nr:MULTISPECIES: biotin transporter BioY [unclassified Bosea (in: a-proteobacteria)]CAD5249142.1 Biotin transporter [Bosea sp. 46]CAD5250148.1 Biotin transporter [Bosea sp. 21B]CAD5265531.1 Biotin transporter [Bosea sp. 7B]VVT44535.1 BioY family transporter [Bosea sp. EC-HK365B]VXB07358.1 Biotin transporter [Bosea sp. 29B]
MNSSTPFAETSVRSLARSAGVIILGVALITLCAKVRVPSWPVPMTLHTLAVMALAVATGPRLATATFFAYLAVGATGLPVFSGSPERGIGLAYMVGPTGGYLLGYLAGSWVAGSLAIGRGTIGRVLAMLAGLGITYALGLPWLAFFVPLNQIIPLGFTPFILGDLINIAMVAVGALFVPPRLIGRVGR